MPSEPRNDWESAVYDLLSEQGDMTWSDAQAMIEAQEVQGNDVFASAWANRMTVSEVVWSLITTRSDT